MTAAVGTVGMRDARSFSREHHPSNTSRGFARSIDERRQGICFVCAGTSFAAGRRDVHFGPTFVFSFSSADDDLQYVWERFMSIVAIRQRRGKYGRPGTEHREMRRSADLLLVRSAQKKWELSEHEPSAASGGRPGRCFVFTYDI